jgi:hypothetical protein
MNRRRASRLLAAAAATAIALCVAGCGRAPDSTYGASRGTSLNGTSVVAGMLKDSGHEVRAAIRLNDELADWAGGIVRFAPYPGPPSKDEAAWYRSWLAANSGRWLIYVVNDFDTTLEYWQSVSDGPVASSDPARKAQADEERAAAADWVDRLPKKAKAAAGSREWFDVDTAWQPPRVCKKLSGPWADGVDPVAAALTVHEPLKTVSGLVLLAGDGKPLVVEKTIGNAHALLIANGSFLLNEAVVNPARRPLAERVIDWAEGSEKNVAMVEGVHVLSEGDGMPTLWALLVRLSPLRWAAIHVGLAALMAALARAPRLGRPRPTPPSGADRPAEHALALGALLARSRAATEARDLLDRYRCWRRPRSLLAEEPRALQATAAVTLQR